MEEWLYYSLFDQNGIFEIFESFFRFFELLVMKVLDVIIWVYQIFIRSLHQLLK